MCSDRRLNKKVHSHIFKELRQLSDSEILFILAFKQSDYTQEALTILNEVFQDRGIYTPKDISDYRNNRLLVHSFKTECNFCGEHLELEKGDLLSGEFACPECNKKQAVKYPNHTIKSENDNVLHNHALDSTTTQYNLEGLGGWLILWSIGLILGSLMAGYWLFHGILTSSTYLIVYYAMHFIFMLYMTYMFFSKKKGFPWLAIGFEGFYAIMALVNLSSSNFEYDHNFYGIIWQAIIWIPYFIKSKRVKATFVNRGWMPIFLVSYHSKVKSNHDQSGYNKDHQIDTLMVSDKANDNIKSEILCPYCNSTISKTHNFCPKCGKDITKLLCKYCSSEIKQGFMFCPHCGKKQD